MAETPATTAKKKLKKKLFHIGLSMAKPLLRFGALLLIADVCVLTGFISNYEVGGVTAALYGALFTALTTTILLLIAVIIYQLCSLKAKVVFHLLEDIRGLLRKTEQTIHKHIQERQEKDFRRTVRLTLESIAADKEQQKELLTQLQALSLPGPEKPSPVIERKQSHLEQLTNFLNQSVDAFTYLQQIYKELQALGLPLKENSTQDKETPSKNDESNWNDYDTDTVLQEILTEVNRLQEQLKELYVSKQ